MLLKNKRGLEIIDQLERRRWVITSDDRSFRRYAGVYRGNPEQDPVMNDPLYQRLKEIEREYGLNDHGGGLRRALVERIMTEATYTSCLSRYDRDLAMVCGRRVLTKQMERRILG